MLLGKIKPLASVMQNTPQWSYQSGEDGIRTHAPVKTNGFQDRPVMTTSVPLHNTYSIVPLADDLFILSLCFNFVNTFI